MSGPCRSGATCVGRGPTEYDCICPKGTTGNLCDVRSSESDDATVVGGGYVNNNDSTVTNATASQMSLVVVKQLVVLLSIGLSIPLLIVTTAVACLVLKRRKFSRRRNAEMENESNNVRYLNNRFLLPAQAINLKAISENEVFLKSDESSSSQNRNLLLRVENSEKYFRKSNNLDRKNVDKKFELDA